MSRARIKKIVSGAQTGVDRAALDAAHECGVEAGGWCPKGRLAEDGRIPERYQVRELESPVYQVRTRKNVIDSDGTLIFYFGIPTGGTKKTIEYCIEEHKPHVLIDAEVISTERAVAIIEEFIEKNAISVLNVAGPRGSKEPRAYDYAKTVMTSVLK